VQARDRKPMLVTPCKHMRLDLRLGIRKVVAFELPRSAGAPRPKRVRGEERN